MQMCPFSSLLLSYLFTGMGFVSIVMVMSCLLLSSATMEAKFSAPVGSKVMVMFVFIFGLNEVVHPLVPHDASNSNTFLCINFTYHYVAIAFSYSSDALFVKESNKLFKRSYDFICLV